MTSAVAGGVPDLRNKLSPSWRSASDPTGMSESSSRSDVHRIEIRTANQGRRRSQRGGVNFREFPIQFQVSIHPRDTGNRAAAPSGDRTGGPMRLSGWRILDTQRSS